MRRRILASLLGAVLVAGCATVPAAPPLKLAITVDDLPVHSEPPPGESTASVAASLADALVAGGARDAYGFINGAWTERDPKTVEILQRWRQAGLPLANHGWSHRHLSEISLAEFEAEVARNEPLLRQLSSGEEWRWFRFPFLDEGGSDEKRSAARQILGRRGYKVAAVTMDFSDWLWPSAHARCEQAGDTAAILRMEELFLTAARENIAYSRARARQAVGRDIPYVLLLHASAMTARMMPRLLELYEAEGFRFVPLADAQDDPFYQLQNDPALPLTTPRPSGGIEDTPIPSRTDFAPQLELLCR